MSAEPSFRRAIVRPPGATFAAGLTTADLGAPDLSLAREQHDRYCRALEDCGLELVRLPADDRFPDSTFVEDTAVLTPRQAILTRPGAPSRAGEVAAIEPVVARFFADRHAITAPGTLDGGDVCEAGGHVFIGVSQRTNEAGAEQLRALLAHESITSAVVDIRATPGILHLKSGVASLGEGRLAVIDVLAGHDAFAGYELVRVDAGEEYAANCVRINDRVLVAAGFPRFDARLRALGYETLVLEMSEFRTMDGGLSCLSLRF